MLPRSRLLVVVVALLAAVGAVVWLARGDFRAPAAGVDSAKAGARRVATDAAPGEHAAVTAVTDTARESQPAREELAVEPQSLHGIVVDEAGMPVADAMIACVRDYSPVPETATRDDGRFAIERTAEDRASHVKLRATQAQF